MTANDFRAIALSFPDTAEGGHMAHPDFRRDGKIFATLGYPNNESGMLKLTPEEQAVLIAAKPEIFAPVNGAWGIKGSTLVKLSAATNDDVRNAMELAWQSALPKKRAASGRRR